MGLLLLQGSAALNPRELFANGEQGLWLDPSDFSTMFQDSNGVTPCTAAGDPVGLILDQSRGGLGALGSDLVTNGGFDSWSGDNPVGWAIEGTENATNYVTESSGAARVVSDGSTMGISQTILTVGKWYAWSADVISVTGTCKFVFGTTDTPFTTPGRKGGIVNANGTKFQVRRELACDAVVDNISIREVPGNHAFQTSSASRPTLQTTSGLWYLSFDGSDDSLVTNAVDFSATDEMTVIVGVRKLSDAANSSILELTTSPVNNGAISIQAPGGAPGFASYRWTSQGTSVAIADAATGQFAAPISNVVTGQSDISGDSAILRVNGSVITTTTTDQGSGNYANAALYIGRRGGSSNPFNGHIYQLIIRGKTTPTGKLLEAERFVARRTGVTGI